MFHSGTSNALDRRTFLRMTSRASYASAAGAAMVGNLFNASRASAMYNFTDYKALICLFLFGGNDSFNMLIPRTTSGYNEYAASRGPNSLPITSATEGNLRNLNFSTALGTDSDPTNYGPRLNNWNFSVHPKLENLQKLFNGHADFGGLPRAAFLANVGTLVEPILNATEANTNLVPLGLYSHSDQIAAWQTLRPQERGGSGWAARLADRFSALDSLPVANSTFFNISLAGQDPVLMGGGMNVLPYRISAAGASKPEFLLDEASPASQTFNLLVNSQNSMYPHIMDKHLLTTQRRSKDALNTFNSIVTDSMSSSARGAINAAMPDASIKGNPVAEQLRTVATMMAGRNVITARRQIFFVGVGGWDQHDNLKVDHAANLEKIDNALGMFVNALRNANLWTSTTLFSCSDFGRTLTSNGDGSDHGWGGNQFIIGGKVRGGMIYGKYPRLNLGNSLDTGRGRFVPTTPVDRYLEEMLTWFGLNSTDINSVLPNLPNFSSSSGILALYPKVNLLFQSTT
jgi:uncharacterized protein (DUF1501 family)